MSERALDTSAKDSAGSMLRAARVKQGLHIAALAATIKISVRKLEALENDRYDELPDATFTRALALTVCRALKIEPAAVLEQLPHGGATGLSQVKGGLNTPFRDRPGRSEPGDGQPGRKPLVWAAVLMLVAAAVVYLLPAHWWRMMSTQAASVAQLTSPGAGVTQPAASAAGVGPAPVAAVPSAPDAAASAVEGPAGTASEAKVVVTHSVPAASAPVEEPGGLAVLRVTEATWVEVVDAKGQMLVSRTLQTGESIGLDGALPFKLKIGNAQGAELLFRSQPVNLAPFTRDNVARLELK